MESLPRTLLACSMLFTGPQMAASFITKCTPPPGPLVSHCPYHLQKGAEAVCMQARMQRCWLR